MVVMTIQMQVRPSKLKELLQTLEDLRRAKRKEKGFLDSLAFIPNGDNDVLTFIEQWECQEDLDAYLQSYYFSVLRGALKALTSSSSIFLHYPTEREKRQLIRSIFKFERCYCFETQICTGS